MVLPLVILLTYPLTVHVLETRAPAPMSGIDYHESADRQKRRHLGDIFVRDRNTSEGPVDVGHVEIRAVGAVDPDLAAFACASRDFMRGAHCGKAFLIGRVGIVELEEPSEAR